MRLFFLILAVSLSLQTWAGDLQFKSEKPKKGAAHVTGCENSKHKSVSLDQCLADEDLKKSLKYYWKSDKDMAAVESCELVTESYSPFSIIKENLPMTECLDHNEMESVRWKKSNDGNVIGCAGNAAYRSLRVAIDDFNWCAKKLADQISYRLIVDSDKNTMSCQSLIDGKTIDVKDFQQKTCAFDKDVFTDVVFSKDGQIDPQSLEDLTYAWDQKKDTQCLLVTSTSLKNLGVSAKENCSDAILVTKDGQNKIVNEFHRTSTFRQMLLNSKTSAYMTTELGEQCVNAINNVTKHGGSLSSSILKKSIKPLSSIRLHNGVQHDNFYHWTSDPGLFKLFHLDTMNGEKASALALKDNTYEQIFTFLRSREADWAQFWRRVFYVAEDKQSSAFLGNRLIEFKLDMKSNTISYDHELWQESVDEAVKKYPAVEASCHTKLDFLANDTFGQEYVANIFFIVAEDSGVDVIDFNQGARWFQILSPKPFRSVREVK